MNALRICALLFLSGTLWANPASLNLIASEHQVNVGDTVTLQVAISGIGSTGAQEVGSFDMFVGFDPNLLVPTGVTFTLLLGDPNLGEAITDYSFGPYWAEAVDVSLLDVSQLDAMQPSSFTLATYSFNAIASGTAGFSYLGGPVDDGYGNLIAGTKTFIPETSSLWLLGSGSLACGCWRFRRLWHIRTVRLIPRRGSHALLLFLVILFTPVVRAYAQDEATIKVVPIRWCLLDDGANPHNPPAGRFDLLNLLLGLLGKDIIWAQQGIIFVPQGFPITVPDPNANGGDVHDDDGDAQFGEVVASCDDVLGQDAPEKIVDVLIRQFVHGGNKGPSRVKGKTELGSRKAVTKDPDDFPNFASCQDAGGDANASFVRSLAHENGHAMGLDHPPNMPRGRLMSQTMVTTGCGLTDQEGKDARDFVDNMLSGVRPKFSCGGSTGESTSRTRESVNQENFRPQLSESWIAIVETQTTKTVDGNLLMTMNMKGLIPATTGTLRYIFVVDIDNNVNTGGNPTPGFAGADLVGEVDVTSTNGSRSVQVKVSRFSNGQFVQVHDSRITGTVTSLIHATDLDTVPDQAVRDSIRVFVPSDLFLVPWTEGYRVGAFTIDTVSQQADSGPIVNGSITKFPEPMHISLKPLSGGTAPVVQVVGQGFSPSSPISIYLGSNIIGSSATDASGAFTAQFTAPALTDRNSNLQSNGHRVASVVATDGNLLSDGMFYDPRACDINNDGQVDSLDISAIVALRGQSSKHASWDVDCDGTITTNDARACALQCTKKNCAR